VTALLVVVALDLSIPAELRAQRDGNSPPSAQKRDPRGTGRGNARQPNNSRRQGRGNRPANNSPRPASGDAATPSRATVPLPKPARQPVAGLDPLSVARQIDGHIQARLDADKVPASPASDDAEFIRRAYLDITGVIPPADKVVTFLGSDDPAKRAKLIDELLASPDYGRHFADLWCDRINVKDMPIYREPFIEWLAGSLNAGRGWDEIVSDVVTAEGRFNFITRGKRLGSEQPQALLLLLNTEQGQGKGPNAGALAGESGRLFLGVQLQCAECHDHPFTETWKQTDFWGLAAFFGRVGAQNAGQQQGMHWSESPAPAGEWVSLAIPATALKNVGQHVPGRLLGEAQDFQPAADELLRQALARWMTAPSNPYFAKATANRMWAHFFGRGLVNPVDDMRPDNPPSHPEVLETLAAQLHQSHFDLKHLIRCLCLSAAYQRTSVPLPENEQDASLYSHQAVKTMGPGVFYDSLVAATGWPELKVGLPERKTKLTVASLFTPREVFVDFFRAAQGEEADPLDNTHGIPQALKLMNATQLNSVAPVAAKIAESGRSRDEAIEQLYFTALARRPTPEEFKLIADYLAGRNDVRVDEGYHAVLWTLFNSAEFVSIR
jgi:hypothetical protein